MAITGMPVVVVPSRGLPVTIAPIGLGLPVTVAPTGLAVTILQAGGGMPVADVGGGLAATLATYYLTAQSGAFVVTPSTITDLREPIAIVSLLQGDFALAAIDIVLTYTTLPATYTISLLQGDFVLTGTDMVANSDYTLTTGIGAVLLTAVDPLTLTYTGVSTYTGPGDLTGWSGAYAYWGLRAYTAAKATALASVIQITDQAGAHATDIHVTAAGAINLTEIAAFKTAWSPTKILLSRWYDQSANGRDLSTVVGGSAPFLTENVINTTLPAVTFSNATGVGAAAAAAAATALAQPLSIAMIQKFAAFTTSGLVFTDGSFNCQALGTVAATNRNHYAGTSRIDYTGTDNIWESVQSILNGASSTININNNNPTGTSNGNPGTGGILGATRLTIGGTDAGSALFTGNVFEVLVVGTAVSSANQTAMYNNAHTAGLV